MYGIAQEAILLWLNPYSDEQTARIGRMYACLSGVGAVSCPLSEGNLATSPKFQIFFNSTIHLLFRCLVTEKHFQEGE